MELFDADCHLAFFPGDGLPGALDGVAGFLNCTVTPAEYDAARERFAAFPQVRTAIGLHPWYLDADGSAACAQVDAVCERIGDGGAVGEVGLDFGPRHAASRDAQVDAFRRIMRTAAARGGCVASIHSVQASETVLDILEACGYFAGNTAIFHWYSGSSAHLTRALAAGALFSANPHMLVTKRGREYLRIIPLERLLTETDLPAEDGSCPAPIADELARLIDGIAAIRGMEAPAVGERLAANARAILASATTAEGRHA